MAAIRASPTIKATMLPSVIKYGRANVRLIKENIINKIDDNDQDEEDEENQFYKLLKTKHWF
jgi:hypothetical protein